MKNIILAGSIAFDHLMKYKGLFKDSLIDGELDKLSISFLAPDRQIYHGGCAANIAYALNLLDESPMITGVAGNDFEGYKKSLEKCGISTECIKISKDNPTAAAFILTDTDQNQISIFSPGAMADLDLCMNLDECMCKNTFCALISPGMPERMLSLAQSCIDLKIPFIFDPGQAISALGTDSLGLLIDCCWGMVTNHYELELLESKLSLSRRQISAKAGFMVVTRGKEGCDIYKGGTSQHVDAVSDLSVIDITGAGDAFRAGLLHGLNSGTDLKRACEIASTTASYSVVTNGTQNFKFTTAEFNKKLIEFYRE